MEDDSRLTEYRTPPRTRFVPVLIMAEGFPVNPITSAAIEARLRRAGILQRPLIAPLHVIDRDERSPVEGLVEHDGRSFAEILAGHEKGSFHRMSLRDWLLVEERVKPKRPSRLEEPFGRAWQPVLSAVRGEDRSDGGCERANDTDATVGQPG